MKLNLFIVSVFTTCCFFANQQTVHADSYGTATSYSSPPQWTRLLASDGSPGSTSYSLRNLSNYEPVSYRGDTQSCDYTIGCSDLSCNKKSFWKRIQLYGWIEGGFYVNSKGNRSEHYRAVDRNGHTGKQTWPSTGNSAVLGNVRSTEPMVNQLWLGFKRDLDTRRGWDWGFQADFMYGTDGWLAQSFGDASFDYKGHHRDYYTSIPQVFASFGYRDLTAKIGKFETLLGYEHLQAPQSFFYSHSNLFYTEPQSHSGVMFEYKFRPNLWFNFGYVMGADNSFENDFDDHGFLGGVYWRPCPAVTVWYTLYAASRGGGWYDNGERHPAGNVFQNTFVTNWKITNRWDYSFQFDYGNRNGKDGDRGASYHGTAHYLTYKINSCWKAGLRFDYLHSNSLMSRSGFGRPGSGYYYGDLYSLTLGFNWTPHHRINIRPELRYDHADDCRPFDDNKKRDQFSAGCGLIYKF